MDKRRWIALIIVPLIALTGYGSTAAYNIALDRSLADGELGPDFMHWSPTPADIYQAMDSMPNEKQRQEKFAELFAKRFRRHEPPIAIGMRFLEGNRIKLMCPARMEPWNMDRLALATWKETREDFGHPFDIDIYITFIGSAPVRVGELRPMEANPNFAEIHYHRAEWVRTGNPQYIPLLLNTQPWRFNLRAFLGGNGR
jgi:hypothetical protein